MEEGYQKDERLFPGNRKKQERKKKRKKEKKKKRKKEKKKTKKIKGWEAQDGAREEMEISQAMGLIHA
jgi:hypothetical protein